MFGVHSGAAHNPCFGRGGSTWRADQLRQWLICLNFSFCNGVLHLCLWSSMGSYGDCWLRCAWCWRWGKCKTDTWDEGFELLITVDCVGLLCQRCLVLGEPPWRPNNRRRYATMIGALWLRCVLGNSEVDEIACLIASFVAANVP